MNKSQMSLKLNYYRFRISADAQSLSHSRRSEEHATSPPALDRKHRQFSTLFLFIYSKEQGELGASGVPRKPSTTQLHSQLAMMYFSEPREVTLNRKYSISIWGKKTSQIQVHTPSTKSKSEVTMTPSTDGNILTAERTHRMEGLLIKLSGSCSKQGYLYLWVWPVLDSSFPVTVTV